MLFRSHQPAPWLALGGILLTAILVQRRVPGAILLGIVAITVLGLFVTTSAPSGAVAITPLPKAIIAPPASLAPTFLKLDLAYPWHHPRECIPVIMALLFVDLFDNMGTLIGVCQRAGLLDPAGNLPRIGRALAADATAAMVGSTLGTSTVTSYIESAAGVEAGGRTGLAALSTAACFLLALFLNPLISVIPAVATAPALVIVGIFMMQSIAELDLRDFPRAVPVVLTLMAMPMAFSIAEGIAIGISVHVLFNVGIGRARSIPVLVWILAALCIAHLALK